MSCCICCWNEKCNLIGAIIGLLLAVLELILVSIYHTAWLAVVISIGFLIASLTFIWISLKKVHLVRDKVWYRVLWVCYTVGIGFLVLMIYERSSSLTKHEDWRVELDGEFPSACGKWAEEFGCTRVV